MSSKIFLILLIIGGLAGVAIWFILFSQKQQSDDFDEVSVESYSFEEAIRWFKGKRLDKPCKACILREDNLDRNQSGKMKLQHCFLDSSNEPLLGKGYPVLIVKTDQIDTDLKNAFSDREMLILE